MRQPAPREGFVIHDQGFENMPVACCQDIAASIVGSFAEVQLITPDGGCKNHGALSTKIPVIDPA